MRTRAKTGISRRKRRMNRSRRLRAISTYAAAQTTRAENDDLVVHLFDQVVVYGGVAQFVDQVRRHCRVPAAAADN